jgi:subtilisin family serine protease
MRRRRLAVLLVAPLLLVAALGPAHAADAPNDPDFPKQYGPVQVGALDAWSKSRGEGVLVAVVDSGVDVDHPDLAGKLVVRPGSDLADGDDDPDDDSELQDGAGKAVRGHGTGGAGVIAAATNNGIGMAGVAPDAKILPVKVFPSDPNQGLLQGFSAVPNGIRFAVAEGAKVINLSLGSFSFGSLIGAVETPCRDAYNQGALCIVSSGNDRQNRPESGYDRNVDFLIVTANDKDAQGASFAQNADTKWGLSAPGVGIWTTTALENGNNGYAEVNGTSFSAPHASGVAALLFAQGLEAPEVVQRMLSTARPMGEPTRHGAGLVDAAAAVGAPRTEVSGTPEAEATNREILLPKAATRTPSSSVPPGGPAAPAPAGPTEVAPVAEAAGEDVVDPNAGFGDEDFNADLTGATSDQALGLGPEPAATRSELVFYMVAMMAGTLLLVIGLATWIQVRRRRLATA